MKEEKALVVIPARLEATRLPNKPLEMIGTDPMIVHVWRIATKAKIGPVLVACGNAEIANAIKKVGGEAIMTDNNLPSGSDRVWQATNKYDPQSNYRYIINVQGDLPILDPVLIEKSLEAVVRGKSDIGTLVAEAKSESEKKDPNVVKVAADFNETKTLSRALYFSRSQIPHGEGSVYHHIGIYAYTRKALKQFVNFPISYLEKREKLEQLRALVNGLKISVCLVDSIPFGVDTLSDLEKAREILKQNKT